MPDIWRRQHRILLFQLSPWLFQGSYLWTTPLVLSKVRKISSNILPDIVCIHKELQSLDVNRKRVLWKIPCKNKGRRESLCDSCGRKYLKSTLNNYYCISFVQIPWKIMPSPSSTMDILKISPMTQHHCPLLLYLSLYK